MSTLRQEIVRLFDAGARAKEDPQSLSTFVLFRDALTRGEIRAAEKTGDDWTVNAWVKQGILLGFRLGELEERGDTLVFVDKNTFPPRALRISDQVRMVPG
jgi:2,3,4,5-tetrahydropyridine-2,6-dicarboxylate N-succinyltransferase